MREKKVDIQSKKVDIESILSEKTKGFSSTTITHIYNIFKQFGLNGIFGRSSVTELTGLQNSSASKLITKLVKARIIEPVSGHGKGKYRFSK